MKAGMANLIQLLPLAILLVLAAAYHGPDLPPGPYCGIAGECCRDREDRCSHKILDWHKIGIGSEKGSSTSVEDIAQEEEEYTICYCDEHCNRTHDDCCPDYEEVCLGLLPESPPEPIRLGACIDGQTRMEECNLCKCELIDSTEYDWVCEREACMIDDDVTDRVNDARDTWRAASYAQFKGKKLKDGLKYKLGTLPLSPETKRMEAIRYDKDIQYPSSFDSRSHWPGYVSPVIDQGWCGSDWAVAIAGVTSDRLAIRSNGLETVTLSPQTMLSCNFRAEHGCDGGHIDVAWNFVRSHGLVDEQCFPYQASVTPCPFTYRGTLQSDGCVPAVPERTSRYTVGHPHRLKSIEDIMYDIMESGPVFAIMTVRQDFFHYKEGVYRHTAHGDHYVMGLHSVRIVGWGEEKRQPYWIVANSWGPDWGEDGYFRIAKGDDESGIESFVVTVPSDVTEV